MDNNTAKSIGFAVASIAAIYLFMQLLPYLVMFLALCGAWHLLQEHNKRGRF